MPLLDELVARELRPLEVWADRGYDSRALRQALIARGIAPEISHRRRAGQLPAPELVSREVWRGRRRERRTRDPRGRCRWPIERTNAWLKAMRRIATRRERKASNYLAFLQLGMIVILARSF